MRLYGHRQFQFPILYKEILICANLELRNGVDDQIRQWVSTIRYAFTNKIDIALLTQYDSQEDQFLSNFNLHWIPKIRFLFGLGQWLRPVNKSRLFDNNALKFVWRVTF